MENAKKEKKKEREREAERNEDALFMQQVEFCKLFFLFCFIFLIFFFKRAEPAVPRDLLQQEI